MQIQPREDVPLSADRKYNINCTTAGSRPPAKITWYMDGNGLEKNLHMDGKDLENFTQEVSLNIIFILFIFFTYTLKKKKGLNK